MTNVNEEMLNDWDIETYRYMNVDPMIEEPDDFPRLAFLFRIEYDHETGDHTFWFTFARCNETDQFSKETARKLLQERMMNKDVIVGDYFPELSLIQNAYQSLIAIIFNPEMKSELSENEFHILKMVFETMLHIDIMNEKQDRIVSISSRLQERQDNQSSQEKGFFTSFGRSMRNLLRMKSKEQAMLEKYYG